MEGLYIFFAILTFVVPAVCILADDRMWERSKKS